MNNFERLKKMNIDDLAKWMSEKYSVCELDKPCKDCVNNDWCSAETQEDFKKWLSKS